MGRAAAKATKLRERGYRKHQLPRPGLFLPADEPLVTDSLRHRRRILSVRETLLPPKSNLFYVPSKRRLAPFGEYATHLPAV
jgi:hypothetical protein